MKYSLVGYTISSIIENKRENTNIRAYVLKRMDVRSILGLLNEY